MSDEKYFVRVQLIRSDKEGEYISQSFDYEISPSTEPYHQPVFLRAEDFYKRLQSVLKRTTGKVTVTSKRDG